MGIKIDYELLSDLAREKDHIRWLSRKIIMRNAYIHGEYIISSYTFAWPDFVIRIDEYLPRLKQKERDIILNNILR
jgi:hypothetical protein